MDDHVATSESSFQLVRSPFKTCSLALSPLVSLPQEKAAEAYAQKEQELQECNRSLLCGILCKLAIRSRSLLMIMISAGEDSGAHKFSRLTNLSDCSDLAIYTNLQGSSRTIGLYGRVYLGCENAACT